MTKGEEQVIRNIVARLSKPNCGCANQEGIEKVVQEANAKGIEIVSRIYLDTWVVPALKMLLHESRDVELARQLSGR